MPIKAYVGLPRSGKTYEVTSVVIYNALKLGRRVVSNIAGLNQDAYFDLLTQEGLLPESLGSIVSIDHDDVLKPNFWLNETDFKAGVGTFIQAGDLLVLDEIWRFWDGFSGKDTEGNKMPAQVMNFFRMHGHFVNPKNGFTCEMAFITQDVTDCGRKLRVVIDETFRTTKLTALGSTSRYRIDVFTRSSTHKKPLRQLYGQYHSKYFPLYKSNSMSKDGGADAREVSIDKRSNILSGKFFKFGIPVMLLVLFLGYKGVVRVFNPHSTFSPKVTDSAVVGDASLSNVQHSVVPALPVLSAKTLLGYYKFSDILFLVVRDSAGFVTHTTVYDSLSISGLTVDAVINGEHLTNAVNFTQGQPQNALIH